MADESPVKGWDQSIKLSEDSTKIEIPELPAADVESFARVSEFMSLMMDGLKISAHSPEELNYTYEIGHILRSALKLSQEPATQHRLQTFVAILENEKKSDPVAGWEALTVRKGILPTRQAEGELQSLDVDINKTMKENMDNASSLPPPQST